MCILTALLVQHATTLQSKSLYLSSGVPVQLFYCIFPSITSSKLHSARSVLYGPIWTSSKHLLRLIDPMCDFVVPCGLRTRNCACLLCICRNIINTKYTYKIKPTGFPPCPACSVREGITHLIRYHSLFALERTVRMWPHFIDHALSHDTCLQTTWTSAGFASGCAKALLSFPRDTGLNVIS